MSDLCNQSVGGIVLIDNKVLLVKHTYGAAKGKYLIPGGYVKQGELATDAIEREILEETGINAKANELISVRFSQKDWYCVFLLNYISGNIRSDNDENDDVVLWDMKKAIEHELVTDTSKILIKSILEKRPNFSITGEYTLKGRVMFL